MASAKKAIDISKLSEGLNALKGIDFIQAERQARASGETALEISFSKKFQTALAARALGVVPDDLEALPVKEYLGIVMQVFNFLFEDLGKQTQQDTTGKLQ